MREQTTLPSVATGDVLELIGQIYDASVAPQSWPTVLESCRQFVGGASAAIFRKSVTGHRRQLLHADGRLDAALTEDYFAHWAPTDPSNTVQVFSPIEQGTITSRSLTPQDFAETRFAREWAFPQGMIDIGSATLDRHGDCATIFGVFRHEHHGLGDEDMRQRITLLAPHIRRAVAIGTMLGTAAHEADTFRQTVDALAAAVLIVDADGRLLHANQAGQTLLTHDQLSLDRSGLRNLLPQPGDLAPRSTWLETAGGTRLALHILPLTGARSLSGLAGDAVAALFIQPARFDPPSVPEGLATAFELTPAELRVALATIRFDKVADVANHLGLSEATVKTHLAHIFSKTDTRRQADIVKLIAAFASPLLPRQ